MPSLQFIINRFTSKEALLKWAEDINAVDDPMVLTRAHEIELEEAFNDSADQLLIQPADRAKQPMEGCQEGRIDKMLKTHLPTEDKVKDFIMNLENCE